MAELDQQKLNPIKGKTHCVDTSGTDAVVKTSQESHEELV